MLTSLLFQLRHWLTVLVTPAYVTWTSRRLRWRNEEYSLAILFYFQRMQRYGYFTRKPGENR